MKRSSERLAQYNLGNGIFEVHYLNRFFLMNTFPIRIIEIDKPLLVYEKINANILSALKLKEELPIIDFQGFGAVEFIATTRCNLRCTHCTARAFDDVNDSYYGMPAMDMSRELMFKAIDDSIQQLEIRLNKYPIKNIQYQMFITGGEPLLVWKDLEATLYYAKNKLDKIPNITNYIFNPHIVTNGILIDKHIAKSLKEVNAIVTVALDSPFNEVRIDETGKPATPKAIVGLKNLIAAGHKRASVNVVIAGESIDDLDLVFSYLENNKAFEGITTIQLSALAPPIQHTKFAGKGLSCLSAGFHDENICKCFSEKLIEYSTKFNLDMKNYGSRLGSLIKQGGTRYRCPVAEWKWCIVPNGDIYACHQLVGISDFFMGNINEENWYDLDISNKIRNKFKERTVFKTDLCKDCALCSSCMVFVDCPARSYLEEGDIYKVTKHYCLCGKTYLEKLLGEHIISLADNGTLSNFPYIKS